MTKSKKRIKIEKDVDSEALFHKEKNKDPIDKIEMHEDTKNDLSFFESLFGVNSENQVINNSNHGDSLRLKEISILKNIEKKEENYKKEKNSNSNDENEFIENLEKLFGTLACSRETQVALSILQNNKYNLKRKGTNTKNLQLVELPLVRKSYIIKYLRQAIPAMGERPCIAGQNCESAKRNRYGQKEKNLLILKEFLLPNEEEYFLKNRKYEKGQQLCFICNIFNTHYMSRLFLSKKKDPTFGSCTQNGESNKFFENYGLIQNFQVEAVQNPSEINSENFWIKSCLTTEQNKSGGLNGIIAPFPCYNSVDYIYNPSILVRDKDIEYSVAGYDLITEISSTEGDQIFCENF